MNKVVHPNGCGPKGLQWLVPNFCFERACHIHDVMYADSRVSRKDADKEFLKYMKLSIQEQNKNKSYYLLAYLYYFSVRTLGWLFRKTKEIKKK